MSTLAEKRLYSGNAGERTAYLATGTGVIAVSTSDDHIGGFGIEHRCTARDLAVADGRLAVATDEAVLLAGEEGYESTGFGPAVAVGFDGDGDLLAADPEDRIARRDGGWTTVGTLDTEINGIDGDLLATAEGVYRAGETDLQSVGLDTVADVSASGVPLAATDDGLYRLGNGWMNEIDGAFRAVSAPPADPGVLDRACGATDDELFVYADSEWADAEFSGSGIADVAVAEPVYAVTADGTFFVNAGEGWRSQVLGIGGVAAMTVM